MAGREKPAAGAGRGGREEREKGGGLWLGVGCRGWEW